MEKNAKKTDLPAKKKVDSYDIVFRVGHALLAAAVFPILFFMQLISVKFSLSVVDVGVDLSDVDLSVYRIINILTGKDDLNGLINPDKFKGLGWPAELDLIKGRLIAIAVFLAIIVVSALFLIVWCCVSNKKIGYFIGGAAGLVSIIAVMVIFSGIAKEFTSGNINIFSFFTSTGIISMIATAIGGRVVNIDSLMLGSFANALLMLFIAMVIWTGVFVITDYDGNNSKGKKK